jgi:hypothetical protein
VTDALVPHRAGVGLSEDRPDQGGDHGLAECGIRVSRLRMKCVRHRCQVAPVSVERTASTRPGWASEITSVVPARPRATSLAGTPASRRRLRW